jgi:8-oxo-dGTP pyrophosphatase MutT (NUDIX family)
MKLNTMKNVTSIYLNERPLILSSSLQDVPAPYSDAPVYTEPDDAVISKTLKALEKGSITAAVFLQADTRPLLEAVKSRFTIFVAGGGLVTNPEAEVLLMFRRGKWDLPKGKQDEGESIEDCALREVTEETGLHHISLDGKITETYHYYPQKEQKVLKYTHWYRMQFSGDELTVPQIEEDIQDIQWVKPANLGKYLKYSYQNIADVFLAAGYGV